MKFIFVYQDLSNESLSKDFSVLLKFVSEEFLNLKSVLLLKTFDKIDKGTNTK